jgi:hypothetical protein
MIFKELYNNLGDLVSLWLSPEAKPMADWRERWRAGTHQWTIAIFFHQPSLVNVK